MNVEQLRKQAKTLVKRARAGDPAAIERLGRREPILARAQLVVARENGYSSWPALLAAAGADAPRFVLATYRLKQPAEAMLAARPEIEADSWARLVLGREWRDDANQPGGPRRWPPLLYACHSVFRPRDLIEELLDRGADPNSSGTLEGEATSPLAGAAGVLNDPEITALLLERGANPNDRQAIRGAAAGPDVACLRLLIASGVDLRGTNAIWVRAQKRAARIGARTPRGRRGCQ